MSHYYTKSGREIRQPEKFGASTSRGVGHGAASQHTATSGGQPTGAAPVRNTETLARDTSPEWTPEMHRAHTEALAASRLRREQEQRQGSGAVPTSQPPRIPLQEWSEAEVRFLESEMTRRHRERLARQSGTRGGSSPIPDVEHVAGSGGSLRSVEIVEDALETRTRDAEETPRSQTHASNSVIEIGSGTEEAEGESRSSSDSAEEAYAVSESGRPVPLPRWVEEEVDRNRQAREREQSILSDFPEGPQPSINVGGDRQEFRLYKTDMKGSPGYIYGIDTPERMPLPTVYVRGTPESEEIVMNVGRSMSTSNPRPALRAPARTTNPMKEPTATAKAGAPGWKNPLERAEAALKAVMETVTGGRALTSSKAREHAPPIPPPKDPKPKPWQPTRHQSEDDYGTTTDLEDLMRGFKTPPLPTTGLPRESGEGHREWSRETSESEIDLADRIPTEKKGKGRVEFAVPMIQPSPMLADARRAELQRQARHRRELEEKARKVDEQRRKLEDAEKRLEEERLRIEDEYYQTQYQLAVLASENTAREEAEKLRKVVEANLSDQGTLSDKNEGKSTEGTSASDSSKKEDTDRLTSDATTTDTGSASSDSGKKRRIAKKRDARPTKAPKEKDESKERKEPSEEKRGVKTNKPEGGEPLDIAMRTAQLVFEMQKDSIAEIVRNQLKGLKKEHEPTYSPLAWRGSGYKKSYSDSPSTAETAATLGRDPSAGQEGTLSDESEKDTEEDDDSETGRQERRKERKRRERREKERRRQKRRAMKALKVEKPTPWNGAPVYNKFDKWVDQVDEWQRQHELTDYAVIATMGFLLTDDAKDWFKTNVRDNEHKWTLQELISALFDELFPADMDMTLREMWNSAEQGSHSLRKWHKYLTKLYERVPNLSVHDVRRRFMEGANGWLRERWAEEGFKPDDPKLEISLLLEYGQRFEHARTIAAKTKSQTSSKPRGSGGQSSGATSGKDHTYKKKDQSGPKTQEKGGGQPRRSGQEGHKRKDAQGPSGGRTNAKREPSEREKAIMRAEDRCFECNEQGHTQRNCPKRRELTPTHKNTSKKPMVYNASLRFEAMKTKRGGPTIRLNVIERFAEDGVIASKRKRREERERAHRENEARESIGLIGRILHTHLSRELEGVRPDHEWQRHLPSRKYRFKVETESEGEFNVIDTWRGWIANLPAARLFESDFEINKWVEEMHKSAPIFIDMREPVEVATASMEKEPDSRAVESSDGDPPDLEECWDLDTEYEEDSSDGEESAEEGGSEREDVELWRKLRSEFRSSVAPDGDSDLDSDSDSGGENTPSAKSTSPIRCAMAQTDRKPRAKSKPRETKPKKNFWETLEENSAKAKEDDRVIPHPIILTVYVNGMACRALLDSGAFSDFISTSLVDNLKLERSTLAEAMTLQMAVQGSRSKINARTTVDFSYSTIKCKKTFDIINIASYDMILGTPFYWQHKILAGMNPTRVAIGANEPLPMQGDEMHTILGAMSIEREDSLQRVRDMLTAEAKDLCEDTATSSLPPFRAINHHIPLIDESKIYKYRPSKCPRPLEAMWREKSGEYLRTGRWRVATGSNPIPILLIQKPRKGPDEPIKLRACFDKREQNANTRKLASPLPDQTEVLERIASRKYRSVIDGRDAYEQIRVVEEDVWKTLFNSPSGTMESLVLQQGDCNGPATYQSLMNHIFGPYIGVWMDVYLDDIMIYSDSLKDHIKHVRTVFKILREQKLFLNPKKMQFLAPELHVLGHRITDDGIKMDPNKVDSVAKWPTPTSKELLGQFIGAVGYLADGVRGIRIPMAVLNKLVSSKKIFRWGATEQRAFEQTKELVNEYCTQTRVPLSYEKNAPTIWLVTDASMTGAAGHICQGEDWKTAKPVAFWSGKFSSAEQVYRTHEQEMFAIIESLKRFKHHLMGTKFTIVTDHEKLEKFMTQKDLTRRQIRWLETLSEFDFEIKWTSGKSNIFADALSRIYSNDAKGTERAASEFVKAQEESDSDNDSPLMILNLEPSEAPSRPIMVGEHIEAEMLMLMAAGPGTRSNPKRGKARRQTLWESEASSEESSRSEDSDSSTSEAGATKGEDRTHVSVREISKNPNNSPHVGRTSAAPVAKGETNTAGVLRRIAKSTKRSEEAVDEDGEPEQGSPGKNKGKNNSRKEEYKAMMAKRREREAPPSQAHDLPQGPNDGHKDADKPPTNIREQQASTGGDKTRTEARDDLIRANEAFEEGRLPHPGEDSSSMERSMDVRLTDIISDVAFPHDLEGRFVEDEFFKLVLEKPLHYSNFEVVGDTGRELVYIKDSQRQILCIPDVAIGSRRAREIVITHAHSILAHLGARKTLWYLRENVWWKDMIKDITDYCASCDVCARSKSSNQKPMGLLHPLKVPTRPWEQVGVDFVGPLPEAKNRHGAFDQVMVVIDHLTSMVHLIPARINYRARQVAEVFYDTIYKLHGLPDRIISDRDKIFTSIFWQNLHRLMHVNLKLSSTYHPQTDGATERANRTMVQMIRQAIGSKDSRWLERLPATEWAMNAARSETTGFSPFFLNYGYRPRPLLWNNASKDEYPGVFAFAQRMKDAILMAHDAILEKRVKQTRQANKGRRPAPFAESDLVYLSTRNIKMPKGKTRKLVPKYIGPYKITKVLVPGTSYRLDLPSDLRSRGIHNAFHASLLRLYVPNCDTRFPGRQLEQLAAFGEADENWEVSRIKSHSGSAEEALFELEWSNGDVTWEPLYRVKETIALEEYLEAMGVETVKFLKRGKGIPPSNDPETFVGMMVVARAEPSEDIKGQRDLEDALAELTLISPPLIPPTPTPSSSNHSFIMQQNNRRYDPRSFSSKPKLALRTRLGTPFLDARPVPLEPSFKLTRRPSLDELDVAIAVAKASTTPLISKEIQAHIDRSTTTPAKRYKLYRDIKESPENFFTRIGITGIAEKTFKDVEKTMSGPIRTKDAKVTFERVLKAPKPAKPAAPTKSTTPTAPKAMTSQQELIESTNQLVMLMRELIATASLNNALGMTSMEPLLDIPPFVPRITPAPLPNSQPTDIYDDFGLGECMTQDIVMGNAEAEIIDGVVGMGDGIEGIEGDFEEISSEEIAASGDQF